MERFMKRLILWYRCWLARQLWRPISTAPRDGSVIDLWHHPEVPYAAGFRVTEVWWIEEDQCWSNCMDDAGFTHWSPVTSPHGVLVSAGED